MAKDTKKNVTINYNDHAKGGMIFLLTYIGAAWYFIQVSTGFWEIVLALLKAAIWPVFLIHRVFELLRI